MDFRQLNKLLGNIDIYLLDQILKGRFDQSMKILDAGCGEGRNTHYFIQAGYNIFGIDQNKTAIEMARVSARSLNGDYDPLRFQVCPVEDLFFHREAFDAVISSAVLHFAKDEGHFMKMVEEMTRVLKPGGILWMRTCTDAGGILSHSRARGNGRFGLPDGSERFVLTLDLLEDVLDRFSLAFLEEPKSVLVHGKRSMGVFLFQKRS